MSNLLLEEGRFKASPKSWTLKENKNGVIEFAVNFRINERMNGTQWENISEYDLERIGYFYLSKRDGTVNERTVQQLQAAFGWNGSDLPALQDTDWTQIVVQVITTFEEYNGERRIKIKCVNPENYESAGLQPVDSAALSAINAKWGAKFRATITHQPVRTTPVRTTPVRTPEPVQTEDEVPF